MSQRRSELLFRLYLVTFGLVVFAGVLLWRTVHISVIEGDYWRQKVKRLNLKWKVIEADRGDIVSERGRLLATSLPFFEVRMDTRADGLDDQTFYTQIDSLAWYLSVYVDPTLSPAEHRKRLVEARRAGNRYLLIKKRVNYHMLKAMKRWPIFRRGPNRGGFIAIRQTERVKPYGELASRTIGKYKSGVIAYGLEASYNRWLAGKDGKSLMKRVRGGVWLPVGEHSYVAPQKGCDIHTTLKVEVQDIAHRALVEGMKKSGAQRGVVVIMEVRTGAVRAMVNLRRDDRGRYRETYNDAVKTAIEPGSTFKLATVMALLESGKADIDMPLNLNGGRAEFFDRIMRDASHHGLRYATLEEAFVISSNVGLAQAAWRVFHKRQNAFVDRLRQFGLAETTGIDLLGETPPFIKRAWDKKTGWSGTTLPWMAIGYEVKLTPLQILNLYNAVANNGKLMRPYLVSAVVKDGQVIQRNAPKVLRKKIASNATLRKAQYLLRQVVIRGTAKKPLGEAMCAISAKTGTAQANYYKPNESLRYHSSMVGYFPSQAPKYSMIVLLMDIPQDSAYYGAAAAGPVFREIVDRLYMMDVDLIPKVELGGEPLASAQVPPLKGYAGDVMQLLQWMGLEQVDASTEGEWLEVHPGAEGMRSRPLAVSMGVVPDVRGLGARDAVYLLESAGLKVVLRGAGKVKHQSIPAGTPAHNQTVVLSLE